MRFLVDECTGPLTAEWLSSAGHDVISAYHQARGTVDDDLLTLAVTEERIVITNDEDFGEMIFREQRCHKGVIFLRLRDERPQNKICVIDKLLSRYGDQLVDQFVVVSETQVRFGNGVTAKL